MTNFSPINTSSWTGKGSANLDYACLRFNTQTAVCASSSAKHYFV